MLDEYIVNFSIERTLVKFLIFLMILGACFGGCSYFNKKLGWNNDNPLEQLTESIIEMETGLNIDLTPIDD